MKKQILLFSAIWGITFGMVLAQTNLNFENWTGNEPDGWVTSNGLTTQNGGAQTVFKETTAPGQGSASVKMVTGSCPECPNFSVFGPFGPATPLPNPLGGSIGLGSFETPGISYTQRPISVDFKYKSNPAGNDAGGFWVELTKFNSGNGETETIGEGYFESNTQVTDWTNTNIPIVYYSSLTPDTMNIWVTSSIGSIPDLSAFGIPTPPGLPAPVAGSEFYIDAIMFNLPSCSGFTISVTGTKETSLGANDGTATATPAGGASPYQYSWTTLAATQSINGLIPGYYSVTVTDANQCQKVGSYYVAPGTCNLSVSVSGTNSTSNSIYTGNGTASAASSGGNPPYDYQWNTGATASSVSNLPIGTYAVLVVEQNNPNCAVWGYYTVYGPFTGVDVVQPESRYVIAYPNPSNGKFTLEVPENMGQGTSLEIYNVFGERIFQTSDFKHQTSNLPDRQAGEINLSKFPGGIYCVKVYDGKKIYTEKVIIQ